MAIKSRLRVRINDEVEVKVLEICIRDSLKIIKKRLAFELGKNFEDIKLFTEEDKYLGREYDDLVFKDS